MHKFYNFDLFHTTLVQRRHTAPISQVRLMEMAGDRLNWTGRPVHRTTDEMI